jgi:hypothetical protein
MKLPVMHRILPAVIAFTVLACFQIGCSKQEEPTAPPNSSYYKGPMVTKPKGAAAPQAPAPGRPITSANPGGAGN